MLADGDMSVTHWVRLRFKSGATKHYDYVDRNSATPYSYCSNGCAGARYGPPHAWGRITDVHINVIAHFTPQGADNSLTSGAGFDIHYIKPVDSRRR
jgi:hypothetical protein